MIPLRIAAEVDASLPPFVVRLNRDWYPDHHPDDAFLAAVTGSGATFQTRWGLLSLPTATPVSFDRDVLLVTPKSQTAQRLVRASSKHNTLLVTERCDQLCEMCSQPPKDQHYDWFSYFQAAVLLSPPDVTIGISGGEPTLYLDQLFELFALTYRTRPDIRFHILTNAQHFRSQQREQLSSEYSENVVWGVPLYSDLSDVHDVVVGKAGAHERLLGSLDLLMTAGARVELRTVIMNTTVPRLPSLSRFVVRRLPFIEQWSIMQMERIGYARMNWDRLFFDHSANFELVGEAVMLATASGISAILFNFPLCTIPQGFRKFAVASISDWKQKFLPICEECHSKLDCGGFFEWYKEDRGFIRLGAI